MSSWRWQLSGDRLGAPTWIFKKATKKDLFQDLWDDLLPNKTDWLAQRKNLLGKFTPDLVRSLLFMNQAAKVGRLWFTLSRLGGMFFLPLIPRIAPMILIWWTQASWFLLSTLQPKAASSTIPYLCWQKRQNTKIMSWLFILWLLGFFDDDNRWGWENARKWMRKKVFPLITSIQQMCNILYVNEIHFFVQDKDKRERNHHKYRKNIEMPMFRLNFLNQFWHSRIGLAGTERCFQSYI